MAQAQVQAQILAQARQDFADILTRLQIGDGAFVGANGVPHQANSKRDLLVAAFGTKELATEFLNRGVPVIHREVYIAAGFTDNEWWKLLQWFMGEAIRRTEAEARQCLIL